MSATNKIEALHKEFIWNGKTSKVKHTTLISNYEDGGLKYIDIKSKLKSLHLSWIKRLYNQNVHPWENIPLKLIEQNFGQNILYSNVMIKLPKMFLKFYKHVVDSWSELSQEPLTVESTLMQQVWYNQYLIVENKPIKKLFPFELFIADLYTINSLSTWEVFKSKFNLLNNDYFKWRQNIYAIPSIWKTQITEGVPSSNPPKSQHTLQLTRPLPLEKLTSKQLYLLFLHKIKKKTTSQIKISQIIGDQNIKWNEVYKFGRRITIDSYGRMFHLVHLFVECEIIKKLWADLGNEFADFTFPNLTPKSAYFGFYELQDILINHIHLIFKIAVYNKREVGSAA